jgi:hypothetical protein
MPNTTERTVEVQSADPEIFRPHDFVRYLPEPETPRTNAVGISIIPDNGSAMDSAIWLQRIEDGYELSLSVFDVASGEINRFSGPDHGPVKAITIKTVLDLELERQSFEIGFTNLQSLAVVTDSEAAKQIQDPQSDLNPLLEPYYQVAQRLKEKRLYEGALDNIYSKAFSFNKGEFATYEVQAIRTEFLHLAKKAVAEKFAQDNIPAIYENWFESQSGMPVDQIKAAEKVFDAEPSKEHADAIITLVKSGLGRLVRGTDSAGNALYNQEAHLKFTIPKNEFASYVNLVILHGVLSGDKPYTPQQMNDAVTALNSRKSINSPFWILSKQRARIPDAIEEGDHFSNLRKATFDAKLPSVRVEAVSGSIEDQNVIVRISVQTANGVRTELGRGVNIEDAKQDGARKLLRFFVQPRPQSIPKTKPDNRGEKSNRWAKWYSR